MPAAQTVVRLPYSYRESLKTISADNGCEAAVRLETTKEPGVKGKRRISTCFTDADSSRQRDPIGDADKPIRKYMPKSKL